MGAASAGAADHHSEADQRSQREEEEPEEEGLQSKLRRSISRPSALISAATEGEITKARDTVVSRVDPRGRRDTDEKTRERQRRGSAVAAVTTIAEGNVHVDFR